MFDCLHFYWIHVIINVLSLYNVIILNLRYIWIIEPFYDWEGEYLNIIYEMLAYTGNQNFLSDVRLGFRLGEVQILPN